MSITINIYYSGKEDNALNFAKEMESSGTAKAIREEKGNLSYEYFTSLSDKSTILLVDSWESQEALDIHHSSPMMEKITNLREKYDLHMKVKRYIDSSDNNSDDKFIRK